jgi:acetyltransferase-like isoleucine patch superfamily enzyme
MRSANLGFFRWYFKTLKNQYKQAKIIYRIKQENPTVTIEDDVTIIGPQNLILGKNVVIQKGTILHCGGKSWSNYQGKITIGDNCQVGPYCILYGAGEIEMKMGSGLAMGVRVLSQQLDMSRVWREGNDMSTSTIPLKFEKVVIEEGSWIAANAIILPGVTIGKGSGVSPGAIVHKNVPPFKLAFAPPARIIKSTPPEREGEKD